MEHRKEDVLVSVILPVYQVAPFLPRAIDSVLAQTHRRIEVILVDDGSTDGSGQICDDYARRDERVRVIHQPNGGVSSARNTGVAESRGEFLSFVDPDDTARPELIDHLLEAALREEAQMAICAMALSFSEGAAPYAFTAIIQDEVMDGKTAIRRLVGTEYWQYVSLCTKIIRREVFEGITFPVGYIHEDTFVAHHLFGACQRIVCIREALYDYHVRAGSITQGTHTVKRADDLYAFADRICYAKSLGMDDMMDDFCHEYVMRFWQIYPMMTFDGQDEMYRLHALQSLRRVFWTVLSNPLVPWGEKLRLICYRISPGLYHRLHETGLRKLVGRLR